MTAARDVGLLPLLALLVRWPDPLLSWHLLRGYPAVGHCGWSGVFPQRVVPRQDRRNIFEGALLSNKATEDKVGPGQYDEVILEKSMADVSKGFAAPPVPLGLWKATEGG